MSPFVALLHRVCQTSTVFHAPHFLHRNRYRSFGALASTSNAICVQDRPFRFLPVHRTCFQRTRKLTLPPPVLASSPEYAPSPPNCSCPAESAPHRSASV